MKTIITLLLALTIGRTFAQDSTWITNLTLPTRTAIHIVSIERNSTDSLKTVLYNKMTVNLRTHQFVKASIVAGSQTTTIDSIQTATLADAYSQMGNNLNNISTSVYFSDLKTAIVTPRTQNSYLNTLCTSIEAANTTALIQTIVQDVLAIIQRPI